ncbi:enoyl-CoA hydratase/isomerase family protein [Ottowia sp. GY511]|uniref:Enoyl-CoA hydratase/isomerase family protein n=1 Tax=Ottowia flava TaxID=2675430 RepID=A0ABW4KRW6_9BURK|nr:enoyl-CoA hydratase/isomerase family protein [Ottowia sp. GY511]TXK30973.1 enoyl-CoA hydratase/isomerase family protein [Ottowia sp. GY511]
MTATVTLHQDGAISVVTLNRPERLNAMNADLLRDLHAQLETAQADPATQVIVLTGAGRAFCAGDDLKDFGDQSDSPATVAQTCEDIQRVTRAIMGGPKLVIGAVHGYAVGGGFEWVLNCDMVVAADDLIAFFPEMQLGHFVTGGVTYLLPLALGHQRAMELMVLGERQTAQRLLDLGLVNRVVPAGDALPQALALARTVAERSPVATRLLKKALVGQSAALAAAMETERQNAMTCFANPDTAARIAASLPGKG